MRYGLYPWTWDSEQQEHRPPDGAVCCLDLRPLPEQAKQEQSGGWGFFAWNGGGDPPSDVISLGDGDCRSLQPTTSQRDELRIRLGLAANPQGATLVDVMGDVLGSRSDPTGESGPKPLMPIQGDGLEILLAGHSKVWGAPYAADEVLSVGARGRANRQRDVWRSTMKQALDVGTDHAAKVLGAILRQHGVSMAEIDKGAPGRKSQWQLLMTARDRQRAGGQFQPKRPKTSFTDAFTRSDSSTLGAGWSTYLSSAEYGISSNKAIGGKAGTWGSGALESARLDSDVSSSDHFASVTIGAYVAAGSGDTWCGVAARFSAAAHTAYYYAHVARSSSGSNRLDKIVAGVMTNLGTSSAANSDGDVVTCQPSGSSISGKKNGVVQVTVTDTSITGGTRCGLVYRSTNFAVRPTYDDLLVDDGISAGGQPMALRRGIRQGFARIGRQV